MSALLLIAAAFRLSGAAWDSGIGAHPDERYVVGIVGEMTRTSGLNPFAVDPSFPYGHVPLYLFLLVGGPDRLMAARLLTGILDVGTVALTAALASLLAGAGDWPQGANRRSLAVPLAALFLTVMPLHVQQAHFATADVPLAFFTTGALFFAAHWVRRPAQGQAAFRLAAICAGLAMGCKAGAALLLVPVALAGALGAKGGRERALRAAEALGLVLITFALTNPFAVLEAHRFLSNVATQAALARGAVLAPYTLQYRGTLPYLYPVAQQLVWGMGPVLGLLGFGGLAWSTVRAARGRLSLSEWVVLAWALPFFAFTGGLYLKFPRYLLPLTPVLAAYASQGWLEGGGGLRALAPIYRYVCRTLSLLAVLPAGLLSLALVASYGRPHPWVAASEWIRAHLPPGSVIAVEEWDHPLPLDPSGYTLQVLPVFAPDGTEKEAVMGAILAEADAVVVASRRGYGALARWPDHFPQTRAYYRALFAGERGWAAAGCWARWPSLVGIVLADDPFGAAGLPLPHPDCRPGGLWLRLPHLDESWVVYDHPEVVVFVAQRETTRPGSSVP